MSRGISKTNFAPLKCSKSTLDLRGGAYSSDHRASSPKVKWIPLKNYKVYILLGAILLFIIVLVDSTMMNKSSLRKYFQTLKWTPLPVGVGFALIAFQQYRAIRRRETSKINHSTESCHILANEWEVQAYKLLPLRTVSRGWGWATSIELPEWSRSFFLGSYAKYFGCNLAEAEVEDINKYKCLSELFRRRLKTGVRPIDENADMVSPVDGTILHAGKADCGLLSQVKGISYSAKKFFGPNCWSENGPMILDENTDECYHRSCLQQPRKNDLYYASIYLAPGDYHRFHSPTDWAIKFRRHFPGELLSVNPSIASWIKDLFVLNERVCYMGSWFHGFFSMTAIGATNVGSVVVPFDETLKTNQTFWKKNDFTDHYFEKNIKLAKGDSFGEFNLGSTIVIIFEAPKNSSIHLVRGQKIKVGQPLFKNYITNNDSGNS